MKTTILMIPLAFMAATQLHGQSLRPATINTAGSSAIMGGNEFEWSVGEMALVSTFSGTGIIVTQGILQPSAASTGIAGVSLAGQLQVFPNPATSQVSIRYDAAVPAYLSYSLIDITGKTIRSAAMQAPQGINTQQVDITDLACATYFLEIEVAERTTGSQDKISFKIQKIK